MLGDPPDSTARSWGHVEAKLAHVLSGFLGRVKERFPYAHASLGKSHIGSLRFGVLVSVSFDPDAEDEALIALFACGDTRQFHRTSSKLWFPNAEDRDVVGFEISSGSGDTIAELRPEVLPRGRDSVEYWGAMVEYIARIDDFLQSEISAIENSLRLSAILAGYE